MARAARFALVFGVLAACADAFPGAAPSAGPSGHTTAPEPRGVFVPPAERSGNREIVRLTFPDGGRATLSYPVSLKLAAAGIQPDVDLSYGRAYGGGILFAYGEPLRELFASEDPARIHQVDGRSLEEWPAVRGRGRLSFAVGWLVQRLPAWSVHFPIARKVTGVDLARSVVARQTDDGFPVIDVRAPAELHEGFGEAGGPQLTFGDAAPVADLVMSVASGAHVTVALSSCGEQRREVDGPSGEFGSACLAGGRFFVNAQVLEPGKSPEGFMRTLIEGVEVADLVPT